MPKTPRTQVPEPTRTLFEVVERRVVGTVTEGGDENPLVAGYALAAKALTEIETGGTMEVEFTYFDHTFTARAEPRKVSGVEALSEEDIIALAGERGLDVSRTG